MEGLLVIGGRGPDPATLAGMATDASLIVAADSGLEAALAGGIAPDLVVGDMDSLADLSLLNGFPRERVLRFPRDKDETDTEIGLRVMREMGCGSVTIAGGGGGRIDHLLGIVNLFEREKPPKRWVTDGEDIFLVEGTAEFDARAGQTVSIFPVGSVSARMASTGLRWDLDELEFRRGFPGLSNRALGGPVRLSVGIGKLLVIKLLSEER